MALSKRVLEKAAAKFAALGKKERKPDRIKEIDDQLEDQRRSTRLEEMKGEYQEGLVQPEKRTGPTIIDFSKISVQKDEKETTMMEAGKSMKEAASEFKEAAKTLKDATKTEGVKDLGGTMKNVPLKAHKIPVQYIKSMSAEWKPPAFKEVNKVYPLIDPYAMANLKWNDEKGRLEYFLVEPRLTKEQNRKLTTIKELVMDLLDINVFEVKESGNIKKVLEERINKIIKEYGIVLTDYEYEKILYYMNRDFLGLERIEPLMFDPAIEDISCDGFEIPLYIYHRKYASVPTNITFKNEEMLNRFITRLAQRCGKHISVAEPLLDGALPDGSRVQATFSSHRDISMRGSTFTIRRFMKDPLTITDLLNFGTIPAMVGAYLWLALEYKRSLLVAGGTATGKTSMLNALSMFIPEEAKIVSIEDTPEIRLPHEHWLQKVVRTGFGREDVSGRKMGEITMYDLLRAALRERPDNLIVGEVRGKEAYVLFQGMATGHAGMATIHGDSVDSVVHRLQTPPINLSAGLLQQLNIIMILTKARIKGVEVRRAKEIVEVVGITKKDEPIINTLFKWNAADDSFQFSSDKSYVLQKIIEDKGIDEKSVWEEVQRRTRILKWMQKKDMRYYVDVGKTLQAYYSNPERVLSKL